MWHGSVLTLSGERQHIRTISKQANGSGLFELAIRVWRHRHGGHSLFHAPSRAPLVRVGK
jgi:hypothetical protein